MIATFCPIRALSKVDLPVLGLPISAISPDFIPKPCRPRASERLTTLAHAPMQPYRT